MPSSLLVGGTGVTGSFVVTGLLRRGHAVTVLHSGRHKPHRDLAPWYHDGSVRVLYSSPDDAHELRARLVEADGPSFFFDHVFVLYGNLRKTNGLFVGHCGRFYAATGMVAFDTYGNSTRGDAVAGQMISPCDEDTALMTTNGRRTGTPNSFNPKLNRIMLGEQSVFAHHPHATIVQYGKIYGPHNLLPHAWIVVKRVLDCRAGMVVSPYANFFGMNASACYAENAAEYFLLATERPESRGEVFLALEDKHLTIKQWISVIAMALGRPDFRTFELPTELAIPARPLDHNGLVDDQSWDGGVIYWSNEKAHRLLGYKDVVSPVEGVRRTALWLAKAENHPSRMTSSNILQDPFDYETEDELLRLWRDEKDWHGCLELPWPRGVPGWGHFFYGPGANPGDSFRGDLKRKYAGKFDRDAQERVEKGHQPLSKL